MKNSLIMKLSLETNIYLKFLLPFNLIIWTLFIIFCGVVNTFYGREKKAGDGEQTKWNEAVKKPELKYLR